MVNEGRFPNGTTIIYARPNPTPWPPLVTRRLHLGQPLHLSVTATDAESPFQILTFSLDPGARQTAAIHPATGLLTRSATNTPARAPNVFAVRVPDHGIPPLSDTKSVAVIVRPPSQLGPVQVDDEGLVGVPFASLPGQTHRVEHTDELTHAVRTPLSTRVAGTGGLVQVSNDITGQRQRFHRLVVAP